MLCQIDSLAKKNKDVLTKMKTAADEKLKLKLAEQKAALTKKHEERVRPQPNDLSLPCCCLSGASWCPCAYGEGASCVCLELFHSRAHSCRLCRSSS